ncbi:MAG: HNH endonuclease [Ruminococcaceae bacterium]|nr:HNH endonuclease [Oscillospiraceae bacterium]
MKSLDIGYINKNNQKNLGYRGKSETHYNQIFFEMECLECGHKYLANGCDVWLRKCPMCQAQKSTRQKTTVTSSQTTPISAKSSRKISDKLRYQVLKRDNFKCCACGASPAKDPSIELHIDHVIPYSKGGETIIDNLQTLCSKCNLGKSNL